MQRLITYVERLLARYDCVVVPSFGAFLKESVAPRYIEEERRVYPGRERFSFNAAIKERDNLLEKEYARSYGISLRRARIMVDNEVVELQNTLFTTSKLSFGQLGSFRVETEGKMLFSPREENSSLLGSGSFYGLTSYPLPTRVEDCLGLYEATSPEEARVLTFNQEEKSNCQSGSKKNANYLYFKVKKSSLSLSAACLLFGFLLLFTPSTGSVHERHYSAGFTKVEHPVAVELKEETQATDTQEETSARGESYTKSPSSCESSSCYYVVVACFQTEKKTKEYLDTLTGVPFQSTLGYISYGSRFAVYAFSSKDKEEAKAFTERLRLEKGAFQNAWLLHEEPKE